MIYLASPYWHDQPPIRYERRHRATEFARLLCRAGYLVYSPLTYALLLDGGSRPPTEAYWHQHGLSMMQAASSLLVLELSGWRESRGVTREIEYAESWHMPVRFAPPSTTVEGLRLILGDSGRAAA